MNNTNSVPTTTAKPPGQARMSLASIIRGPREKPIRALIYSVEGVGKSTFGANSPNPIFLCAEDGVSQLGVARFPTPQNWSEVLEAVRVLEDDPHDFKTLCVDSVDWLEPLIWECVCKMGRKNSIAEFDFGGGYVRALAVWQNFLKRLETLQSKRGMNVLLIGHAHVKRVDDPQVGAFDRYRLKLHDKSSDLIREWVDSVLFARIDVEVDLGNRKGAKPHGKSDGTRLIYTTWHAAFDAKNRHELPETIPLDWDEFANAMKASGTTRMASFLSALDELIPRLPADEQPRAIEARDVWAKDDPRRMSQLLNKVRSKVSIAEGAELAQVAHVATEATTEV